MLSPETFPKYLNDPSLLYRISYQELKTLVVQYPYCQNLRYLLLIKSKIDNNKDQERNLKMVSAYTLDRPQLYQLLQKDYNKENKDIEFLDLEQNVETDPKLDLPILDFSKGIEIEEKGTPAPLEPLEIKMEEETEVPDALEQLFSDPDFEQESFSKDFPLPKPIVEEEAPIAPIQEEIPSEKEENALLLEETVLESWNLPLVPPIPRLEDLMVLPEEPISIIKEIIEEEIPKKEPFILYLPLVPCMDLIPQFDSVVLENEDPIVPEEQVKEIEYSIPYPIIPRMDFLPKFILLPKSKHHFDAQPILTEPSPENEIDQGIKEALDKLIEEQRQEEESEEREYIEKELEVIQLKKESDKEKKIIAIKKSDDAPPATTASFTNWLLQTKPPSIEPNEEKIQEEVIEVKTKKMTKTKKSSNKKKKKKKNIKTEGKSLHKIIKAKRAKELKKQEQQEKKRKKKVLEFAEKSLKENEEIVSETLAKILVEQEKYDRAILMYKRLRLKFPEKSSYFAGEIKKITKKKK